MTHQPAESAESLSWHWHEIEANGCDFLLIYLSPSPKAKEFDAIVVSDIQRVHQGIDLFITIGFGFILDKSEFVAGDVVIGPLSHNWAIRPAIQSQQYFYEFLAAGFDAHNFERVTDISPQLVPSALTGQNAIYLSPIPSFPKSVDKDRLRDLAEKGLIKRGCYDLSALKDVTPQIPVLSIRTLRRDNVEDFAQQTETSQLAALACKSLIECGQLDFKRFAEEARAFRDRCTLF